MPPLPVITGGELIRALEKAGFLAIRQRGSHVRMRHLDGRVTSVPTHGKKSIGPGLLRKVLRDAEVSTEELLQLLNG